MIPRRMSAIDYMKNEPHFITWQVYGCSWTDIIGYPAKQPRFDLNNIIGMSDSSGVFYAVEFGNARIDGRKLYSVRMSPGQS